MNSKRKRTSIYYTWMNSKRKRTREREEEKVDMLGSGESGERGSGMLGKEKVIVYTFMFEKLNLYIPNSNLVFFFFFFNSSSVNFFSKSNLVNFFSKFKLS